MIDVFSITPLILILAFLLDLLIGDPRWLPHPVRIIGGAISKTEKILRKSEVKSQELRVRLKGVFLVFIIVSSTFGLTWLIVYIIAKASSISALLFYFSTALLAYLTSTTIAARELTASAGRVIAALKQNNIQAARQNLSMIVGRDTQDLSEKNISKATIETVSENLSDGVIAPVFYLLIGGLPLAMAYKAVNTLDSMVGYKNDRYKDFGWAAARLDDIANYIPARITGALIVISIFFITIFKCPPHALRITHHALRIMINDGRKHTSPNAGIPEAAIAGALSVQLGGPASYGGIVVQKHYIGQYIGNDEKKDYLYASEKAVGIIKVASVLGAGAGLGILYLFAN
jgi:adenosylcobinamide-phosphate synthase